MHLALTVSEPSHEQAFREVAPVRPGSGTYDISLPSACARRCRIVALHLTADTPETASGESRSSEIDAVMSASIRADGSWRSVTSFGDRARWRGSGAGQTVIRSTDGSLALDIRQIPASDTWPAAVSASIPSTLPAVVPSVLASRYERDQIRDVPAVGLGGQSVTTDGEIRAVTLPRVGQAGIMVDLGSALAVLGARPARSTQYQVWLSSSAPPDMAARLARRHVYVKRTIHSSSFRSALDDSGPAFADSLFLVAALAATVLAIGATAVGRVVSVRRRGYELAALEAVGISPRTLRRAMAAEVGSVFGIGLIVGLAAGLVGSRLALPSTPVFVDTSTGPPLVFGLPWALLGVLSIGLVVVFVVVSIAIASLVERAAGPSQLRGAQQ